MGRDRGGGGMPWLGTAAAGICCEGMTVVAAAEAESAAGAGCEAAAEAAVSGLAGTAAEAVDGTSLEAASAVDLIEYSK